MFKRKFKQVSQQQQQDSQQQQQDSQQQQQDSQQQQYPQEAWLDQEEKAYRRKKRENIERYRILRRVQSPRTQNFMRLDQPWPNSNTGAANWRLTGIESLEQQEIHKTIQMNPVLNPDIPHVINLTCPANLYTNTSLSRLLALKPGATIPEHDADNSMRFYRALAQGKFREKGDFCNTFPWNNTAHDPLEADLPLMDTVHGKQIVIGRYQNLIPYYEDQEHYVTLQSNHWSKFLNDVFAECMVLTAGNMPAGLNKFPIRLVLKLEKPWDNEKLVPYPPPPKEIDGMFTTGEICKMLQVGFGLFQSIRYKHIFFFGMKNTPINDKQFIPLNVDTSGKIEYFL